jgi:uncharacterized membrane protein
MTTASPALKGPVLFDATLSPNRSLSRRGLVLLLGLVVMANAVVGLKFWLSGAWLVLPFLGLDVLAIVVAFQLSLRGGRLTERIVLDGDGLRVDHIAPGGAVKTWRFEPYWARVTLLPDRYAGHRLTITSHGKGVQIGDFLSPDEREELAGALSTALRDHRARAPDTGA